MTIDRFPLWVAMSLLGFSPVAHAQDEIPAPQPAVESKAQDKSEEATAPKELPIFGWATDRDLPIFDFDKIPSVLGEKSLSKNESNKAGPLSVSSDAKPEAKKDREIQHYARLYRIWAFESFRHDNEEYRRRVTTAQNMLRVWEYEGCDAEKRDALKSWFHQAALASAEGKPLPECDFLNKDLLDQVAQGIPFAISGGSKAGIAFARALIKGSIQWATPQGMIATAMTIPLPFELPDPALIIADEPAKTENAAAEAAKESPVAELKTTPVTEQAQGGEPETSKDTGSKPVLIEEPATPNATR